MTREPIGEETSSEEAAAPPSTPRTAPGVVAVRWLLPLGGLLALAGYFGPWVPHPAAGLVVTGLDLGEYVKFLHPVQNGTLHLWREGFYLPLVAVSVAFSLHAYRRELAYPWPLKILWLGVATVAALNLLPPAWTPARLVSPAFRLQTAALVVCLGLAAVAPLLALLPRRGSGLAVLVLTVPALWLPLNQFSRILPTLDALYNQRLTPGWGPWVMAAGLVCMAGAALLELLRADD